MKKDGTPFDYAVSGKRNKRSVWSVQTHAFPEAHFATYPPKLIEPMILAGCPEDGLVLDPFFGAGTTGLVAKQLKRNYVGIELNPEYIEIAEKRIAKQQEPLLV
jgi:DNA modification methylase